MKAYQKRACIYYGDKMGFTNGFRQVRNADMVKFFNNDGQSRDVSWMAIEEYYQYYLETIIPYVKKLKQSIEA